MNYRRNLHTVLALIMAAAIHAQQSVRVEYFIDKDPGYGLATVADNAHFGDNLLNVSLDGVEAGAHVLYVRSQDNEGHWSNTISRPFYVTGYRAFAALEYFVDSDPGVGKATAVLVPSDFSEMLNFELPTDLLQQGEHRLCLRAMGTDGVWSSVSTYLFVVEDISGVSSPLLNKTKGDYYNLKGQRMDAPSNGVYIVNGRKIVIKRLH